MVEDVIRPVALPTVRRLPAYLRLLYSLQARGRDVVSCTHIADELGLVSVQVRKDLAAIGVVGKPKIGYQLPALIYAIRSFLGQNNTSDAFQVGCGCLGGALLGYGGFKEYGLNLVAGFDINPAKIGTQIHGREVFPLEKLPDLAERLHILIGILTVPAAVAQDTANLMVLSGMRAIWNYTPVKLEVPDVVIVEDVKLAASLAVLSSRLAESLRKNPAQHLAEGDILGPEEPLTNLPSSPEVEEAETPVA
ncbi:MAG: redox-sensing transcriptional repressor Rex [Thermoguttaceae bacterium]